MCTRKNRIISVVVLYCLFLVSISITCRLMYVHIVFSSVKVVQWPPFGKELPARLTLYALCIMYI